MPADDRLGLDHHEGLPPVRPEANKGYPQEPVPSPKPDTPSLVALKNGQLVTECQDLKLERGTCSKRRSQPGEQRYQHGTHGS
jgi:hypothetical protein